MGGITLQFNPARMVSSGAKVDKDTIAKRPCFLCEKNRPEVQIVKPFDEEFEILINPFPILPIHFTIPSRTHQLQKIKQSYAKIHRLLELYPKFMVFYNGPKCGASAPDHLHLQAGSKGLLPIQQQWKQLANHLETWVSYGEGEQIALVKDFVFPAIVLQSKSEAIHCAMFNRLYDALPMQQDDIEPMMNIVAWKEEDAYVSVVFPRRKHRPTCYSAEGKAQYMISPGALDMGGLLILPRQEDFDRLTKTKVLEIMSEIILTPTQIDEVKKKIVLGVKGQL